MVEAQHRPGPDTQLENLEVISRDIRGSYRTLEEMAYQGIREAILSGLFEPGERIPQDLVAQTFGISRIPLRSALRQLESEGLVVFHPHRGTTVATLTADEVAEIYQLRIQLETFAMRVACEKASAEEIEDLERLAAALDKAKPSSGNQAWLEARRRFYQRLYEIAGLPRTAAIIDRLRAEVGRYLKRRRVKDDPGHQVMVEAIRSRDPARAEQWLRDHLERVSKEIQATVAASGEEM